MFNFIYRHWLIGKKLREYEREAVSHETECSELFLEIRNTKGLIDAEKADIKANDDDIKQDEFEIDSRRKSGDPELFEIYKENLITSSAGSATLPEVPTPEILAEARGQNNAEISKLQQEIKNLKAANDNARESIKQREMELRGVRDPNGKVIKQGLNTRYQGHMAAAQTARIHSGEVCSRQKA